jgi:hypothetical protein
VECKGKKCTLLGPWQGYIFNHVRNAKYTHKLWENICALHEGTKSEHEQHYHIAWKKINSFDMLSK